MTISQYIYNVLKHLYGIQYKDVKDIKDDHCWLCGGETHGKGLSTKDGIGGNFTNQEFAKCHKSKSICEACSFLLKQQFKYDNKNKEKESIIYFRNTSWIITSDYSYPKLAIEGDNIRLTEIPNPTIIRNFIISEKPKLFVFLYSNSGQKHLFFRGDTINSSNHFYQIVFEEIVLNINHSELLMLTDIVESLLAIGYSKSAIKSLQLYDDKIQVKYLYDVMSILQRYIGNPLLEFACNFAINKEDKTEWQIYKKIKKILESTVSTQTTETTHQQVKSSIPSIEAEISKSSKKKSQKTIGEQSKNSSDYQQTSQMTLFNLLKI